MRGLEKEYAGRVTFIWANVLRPDSKGLIEKFSFNATPEIYLVRGEGEVIAFWDEETDADTLRQALDAALEQ